MAQLKISNEKRALFEKTIEEVEFLSKQIEKVQSILARQNEDQSRLAASIQLSEHKLHRMETRRLMKLNYLYQQLQQADTSFVHHGKIYVPTPQKLIISDFDLGTSKPS